MMSKNAINYCSEDISLIENYDKSIAVYNYWMKMLPKFKAALQITV